MFTKHCGIKKFHTYVSKQKEHQISRLAAETGYLYLRANPHWDSSTNACPDNFSFHYILLSIKNTFYHWISSCCTCETTLSLNFWLLYSTTCQSLTHSYSFVYIAFTMNIIFFFFITKYIYCFTYIYEQKFSWIFTQILNLKINYKRVFVWNCMAL